MSNARWNTFKDNVSRWSEVRAVYEQSTEAKQQAKALEEIGEYITAETIDEREDAIGDVAVCIINAAAFRPYRRVGPSASLDHHISRVASDVLRGNYNLALSGLKGVAERHGYDFFTCCEKAWGEIKDRKGLMVNGWFVKWENLTEEQKEEFRQRDVNNTLIRGL